MDLAELKRQHEQLCENLSTENNLEELRSLAKDLKITVSGKRKYDLCHEIALYIIQEQQALEASRAKVIEDEGVDEDVIIAWLQERYPRVQLLPDELDAVAHRLLDWLSKTHKLDFKRFTMREILNMNIDSIVSFLSDTYADFE